MKRKILFLLIVVLSICCMGAVGCSLDLPTGEPHTITIVQKEHGTIEINKSFARQNEKITITAYPEKGYRLNRYFVNGTSFWGSNNQFKMLGEDVKLVPEFTEELYWIEFDEDRFKGQSLTGNKYLQYTINGVEELEVEARKEHYDFIGWYLESDPENVFTSIAPGTIGDLYLYPKFEPLTYSIYYHLPEGATHDNVESYTVEDEDIELTAPEYPNHHFMGWYENKNLIGSSTGIIDASRGGFVYLYPKFYSEIYDDEGYRLINSLTDFEEILYRNYDKNGGKFRLTTDLDFNGKDYYIYQFNGEFDGGNHLIKGFSSKTYFNEWGLFRDVRNATIKNLRVEIDVDVEYDDENYGLTFGLISSVDYGTNLIENVRVEKFHLNLNTANGYRVGSLVGWSKDDSQTKLIGCSVKDIQVRADFYGKYGYCSVGAMVGYGADIERSCAIFEEDDFIYVEGGEADSGTTMALGGLSGNSSTKNCYVDMKDGSYLQANAVKRYCTICLGGLVAGGNVVNSYAIVTEFRAKGGSDYNVWIAGLTCGSLIENSFLTTRYSWTIVSSTLIKNGNTNKLGYTTTIPEKYAYVGAYRTGMTLINKVGSKIYSKSESDFADSEFIESHSIDYIRNEYKKSGAWDFENIWNDEKFPTLKEYSAQ